MPDGEERRARRADPRNVTETRPHRPAAAAVARANVQTTLRRGSQASADRSSACYVALLLQLRSLRRAPEHIDGVNTAAESTLPRTQVTLTPTQERALDAHTRVVTRRAANAAAAAVAGAPQDGVSGARSSTGRSSACTSRCCRTARCWPTTRSATTRPRRTPCRTTHARRCGIRRRERRPRSTSTPASTSSAAASRISPTGGCSWAGGNKDQQLNGIVQTHLFDPVTNLWSLGPNMLGGRWYPTVTPLSNGEMLITSGRVDTPGCGRRPAACVR